MANPIQHHLVSTGNEIPGYRIVRPLAAPASHDVPAGRLQYISASNLRHGGW